MKMLRILIATLFFTASACDASDQSPATTASKPPAESASSSGKLIHDADYYILEAQHGEKWVADDKVVDSKLAEYRARHGGKPPNILYILIDDLGFGDPEHDRRPA